MKITKAILTGGGRATRLLPITATINKHLLPLANKPMIFHAIEKVVAAGIEDIFINTNPGETELPKYVGDGGRWGVNIRFFEQTGGPQGIAHVVHEARAFIGSDPFMFYLSDNILLGGVAEMVEEFLRGGHDCMLALSEVPDPQRFGVPVFDSANRLVDVIEKPVQPPNNFAVTGLYLYGPKVFFETFPQIEKSARGEYEISSIHSHLLKNNRRVGYKEITGWWKDTGKPEDLLLANELLLRQIPEHEFTHPNRVCVGAGTSIKGAVTLRGPALIGENCVLEQCVIGPNASIGEGSVIRGAKVSRSIVLDGATIEGNLCIEKSILGRGIVIKKLDPSPSFPSRFLLGDKTIIEF